LFITSQNTLIFSATQLLDFDCNRTEKSTLNFEKKLLKTNSFVGEKKFFQTLMAQ